MRLKIRSKLAELRNWYPIKVDEPHHISTVVEITINIEAVVCDSFHDFGVEMHTWIHITKVADKLHRAPKVLLISSNAGLFISS